MKYIGKVLHFKQGETFSFAGTVLESETGEPIDSETTEVRSQIREATPERLLIADLECEWLDDGAIKVLFPGDTSEWPFGNALWDIQVVDSAGQVRVTESVEVLIHRYVTRV